MSFQLPGSLTGLPHGRALSQALTLETASGSLHETQSGPHLNTCGPSELS